METPLLDHVAKEIILFRVGLHHSAQTHWGQSILLSSWRKKSSFFGSACTIPRRLTGDNPFCFPRGTIRMDFKIFGALPLRSFEAIRSGPANQIGSSEVNLLMPMFCVEPL